MYGIAKMLHMMYKTADDGNSYGVNNPPKL